MNYLMMYLFNSRCYSWPCIAVHKYILFVSFTHQSQGAGLMLIKSKPLLWSGGRSFSGLFSILSRPTHQGLDMCGPKLYFYPFLCVTKYTLIFSRQECSGIIFKLFWLQTEVTDLSRVHLKADRSGVVTGRCLTGQCFSLHRFMLCSISQWRWSQCWWGCRVCEGCEWGWWRSDDSR